MFGPNNTTVDEHHFLPIFSLFIFERITEFCKFVHSMILQFYICNVLSKLPRRKCRELYLESCRHIFLKHDFAVLILRQTSCGVYSMCYSPDAVGICKILTHTSEKMQSCFAVLYSSIKFPRSVVSNYYNNLDINVQKIIGGGAFVFTWDEIAPHMLPEISPYDAPEQFGHLYYNSHLKTEDAQIACTNYDALIPCRIPIGTLVHKLPARQILEVEKQHNIIYSSRLHVDSLRQALRDHKCEMCSQTVTLFKHGREKPQTVAERVQKHRKKHTNVLKNNFVSRKDAANMNIQQRIHKDQYDKNRKDSLTDVEFPPKPADFKRLHGITKRFCEQIAPSNFIEAGCAVCGQLTLLSELTPLSEINIHLDILILGVVIFVILVLRQFQRVKYP